MPDQWAEFEDATDDELGWDQFETVDQSEVMRTQSPPVTRSERVARDLKFIDLKAGFGTLAKIGYDMGREAVSGLAGIAGTVTAGLPGGEKPSERGPAWLEATRDFLPEWNPSDEGIQLGMEMTGKGMGRAVEEVKKTGTPAAYAGARLAGASPEEAKLSMQDFMEQPNALGEGAFQATGSPTAAVVAQLLPEALAGIAPVKKPPTRTPRPSVAPEMPPSGFGGIGEIDDAVRLQQPSPDAFNRLRDALRRGDQQAVLDEVNANPAIVAAFEELGIEFSPAMVSQNPALRQVEAGLASKADSGLPQVHELVEFKLNEKAQRLVDDAGGKSGDPATTAANIEARYNEIHSDYLKAEEAIWDDLNTKVPRGAEIDVQSVAQQLEETAMRLGKGDIDLGISRMSKHEKELWRLTHRKVKRLEDPNNPNSDVIEVWDYESPPWEAIDRFRRRLGMGLENRGPFNDAEIGEIKNWYGQIAEQQTRFAKGNDYGADWDRMNQLTRERKALEEAMGRTLGRGLNQSVVTRLKSATNALMNGDVKKWDQLFDDLPSDMRQAAAAQALENVFFTAGKGTKMSQSFVANFNKIKRSPKLRDRVLDHLPMDARGQFMAIGEAATGFYRAMEKLNRSNTANAFQVIDSIEKPGWMNRILGGGLERGTRRIPIAGEWIQQITARTPEAKRRGAFERLKAGADLLQDPAFHRAIVEYAAGNVERANEILKNSTGYAKWVKLQPIPQQERILSAGIVALFEETEE